MAEETVTYLTLEESRAWELDQLRLERNRLLRECDWTQLPDTNLSDIQRAEWMTYRQALRDLPQTYPDPSDVTWPTPPA